MLFRPIRFCLNFIAITILLMVISFGALVFFDLDLGNAFMAFLPAMTSAMLEGQNFVSRAQGEPKKSAVWWESVKMMWLTVLISTVMVCIAFTLDPSPLANLGDVPLFVWAGISAVIFVVNLLIIRLGYGLGVKTGLRQLSQSAR